MRRAALALALFLMMATASQSDAGYIIIRVLLEGIAAEEKGDPNDPMGPKQPGPGFPQQPMPGFPPMGFGPGMRIDQPKAPTTPKNLAAMKASGRQAVDHSASVVVVLPLDTKFDPKRLDPSSAAATKSLKDNPYYRHIAVPHYDKVLHASVFIDSTTIQLFTDYLTKPQPLETRVTEFRATYEKWRRDKKDPQVLYDALILALKSGIIRDRGTTRDGKPPPDAMKIAQELVDLTPEQKKGLLPAGARFVQVWEKVSKELQRPVPKSDEAEGWKVRLGNAVKPSGHYALVYTREGNSETTANRRLMQLNDNFDAFYLWHATRGIELPVPEKPLLAVLAKESGSVGHLFQALDGLPGETAAFFSPDHNLLVLAPEPLDGISQSFLRQTDQVFKRGFSRQGLLTRDIPKLDHTGEKGAFPEDVARASTLALVERMMLEESELESVSYEGTRQLMFASGVLPRHVTLPNWLTHGALHSFARPRGPAYVTQGDDERPVMTIAFSTGYGVPNYVLQRHLAEMGDEFHKELNKDPVKLLENVLKDAYFTGIKDADDPDPAPPKKLKKKQPDNSPMGPMGMPPAGIPMPPGGFQPKGALPMPGANPGFNPGPGFIPGPGANIIGGDDEEDPALMVRKKRARLITKASATAWALYYYLANAEPDKLSAYIAELNKLPRDLPIDGRTSYDAFVRVFNLSATKDGPADPARMKKFATEWLDYISTVPRVGFDIELPKIEPGKKPVGDDMNPAGPGFRPMREK